MKKENDLIISRRAFLKVCISCLYAMPVASFFVRRTVDRSMVNEVNARDLKEAKHYKRVV